MAGRRQVRALEIRVGVDHHRTRHRPGRRGEERDDAVLGDGEIGFQRRDHAGDAHGLEFAGLTARLGGGGGGDAGDHRHPPGRRFQRDFHHPFLLFPRKVRELAGAAERRQAVDAGGDDVLAEPAENPVHDRAVVVDGRHQIGENPEEIAVRHLTVTPVP